MPGRYVYIEPSPSGNPRFVRRRSRSYDGPSGGVFVSHEDLAAMRETERALRESNNALAQENRSLKNNLNATRQDLANNHAWAAQLQGQLHQMTQENRHLNHLLRQRSEDNGGAEARHEQDMRELRHENRQLNNRVERLRHENTELEGGTERLSTRVRELVREIARERNERNVVDRNLAALNRENTNLKSEAVHSERRHDALEQMYVRLSDNFNLRENENVRLRDLNDRLRRTRDVYERRLRQNGLL